MLHHFCFSPYAESYRTWKRFSERLFEFLETFKMFDFGEFSRILSRSSEIPSEFLAVDSRKERNINRLKDTLGIALDVSAITLIKSNKCHICILTFAYDQATESSGMSLQSFFRLFFLSFCFRRTYLLWQWHKMAIMRYVCKCVRKTCFFFLNEKR